MADCSRYAVGILARETSSALEPLADVFDIDNIFDLLTELGYTFPPELVGNSNFVNALSAAGNAIRKLPALVEALSNAFEQDIVAVLTATGHLLDALLVVFNGLDTTGQALRTVAQTLPGMSGQDVADFATGLAERLLDYVVIAYLESRYPRLLAFLQLFGVATITPQRVDSNDPSRPPYFERKVRLDRIPTLLTDPDTVLHEEYRWGDADFDGELLLSRLAKLLREFVIPTEFNEPANGEPASLRVLLFSLKARLDLVPRGLEANLALSLQSPFALQFPFFIDDWFIEVGAKGPLQKGLSAIIQPPGKLQLTPPSGDLNGELSLSIVGERVAPQPAFAVLSLQPIGCLLARRVSAGVGVQYLPAGSSSSGEPVIEFKLEQAQFVIPASSDDGFLSSITPQGGLSLDFDFGIGWSASRGVFFEGSGGLAAVLPVHRTVGPFTIDTLSVRLDLKDGTIALTAGVIGSAKLGPITATVDSLAFGADLRLSRGNLGPVDLTPKLVPPNGVGISIDAGGVTGGGFLYFFFDEGRYAGALALSVYSVSVKAFGLIESKLPDGTPGFSFVVVIVAEFTPIQLGFGFTLNGVGGMLGVNRTMNTASLGDAVRTGSLDHLLFPHNVVQDAPAIIHDLATVFPAAPGHFIVGPMAKLGWGTPTLITADLGIILELPGPLLAILGVLRMQLPTPDAALVSLQMAVVGLLDFPAQEMSLDASLYDSNVVGFPVGGDMAFRLGFGKHAKFLLSVGGFNPGFAAPPGTPKLRRLSVDLGVNGNPSLVASGYFALTSNTAQFGASIELNAHGAGVTLHGYLGLDALFVFAPFSFKASISAGVSVKFHGVGFGIDLHGDLSGPSPWHFHGRVCVSILWWDACLGLDISFGNDAPVALPEMDPWLGTPPGTDVRVGVIGLQASIEDSRNWSGSPPPAAFKVVTLAAASSATRTPIDPVGAATLRQKVAPLNQKLEKFGEYRPTGAGHDQFNFTSVTLNAAPAPETNVETVTDDFVPGHFLNLSNAQKLSNDSYAPMDAGISIAPNRVTIGSARSKRLEYETAYIKADGQRVGGQPRFLLSAAQLRGLLGRSAAALGGLRRTGNEKYKLASGLNKVTLGPKTFVVADACSSKKNAAITGTGVSQVKAQLALNRHIADNPLDATRFTVIPAYTAK